MKSSDIDCGQMLAQARELVAHLENDRLEEAGFIVEMFALQRETALFNEVGRFTRELHEALQRFSVDTRLVHITEEEIPDAKQRLNHVISMTEESAHRTLNAIEECSPMADTLMDGVARLRGMVGNLADADESWREDLLAVLNDNEGQLGEIKNRLNDILMAQEFQDVTGQILQQVIELVTRLEDNLVQMLAVAGERIRHGADPVDKRKDDTKAEGPAVPGVDDSGRVSSQDEVDDLLSSLGF